MEPEAATPHPDDSHPDESETVVVQVNVSVDDAGRERGWPNHVTPVSPVSAITLVASIALLAGLVGFALGSQRAVQAEAAPVSDGADSAVGLERSDGEPTSSPIGAPVATAVATATPEPASSSCPVKARRCIEIVDIHREGDELTIVWEAVGFDANIAGHHAHFFWNNIEPAQAGNNCASFGETNCGPWSAIDAHPYVTFVSSAPGDATAICATVANASHGLDDPSLYDCVDIPRA